MIDEPRRTAAETPRGTYPQPGYRPPAAAAAGWQQQQPGRWALPSGLRRISWGAVIAGAAVALVVQLTLNLLGLGIGALTIDPATQQQAVPEGLGLGAALWWLGSVLIALFVGGWFAGYLAGTPERGDGAVHGIVTWSLATILSVWLLTTAVGTIMSGAWNVMQGGLQAMSGQTTAQQDGQQPQQPGQGAQAQQQQQQQPMQQAQEALQQQGPQAAQQAAEAVAWASFWTFAALLLGAVCAALGGLVGSPQDAPRTHRGYATERDGDHEERTSEGYGPERGEREERAERERAEDRRIREQREQVEREQEEYKRRSRP